MVMKKYLIFLLLCVCTPTLFGQIITIHTQDQKVYQSNLVTSPIRYVVIDKNFTLVLFDYITSPQLKNGSISISEKTTLTGKNSTVSLKIKDWGVFYGDYESLQPNGWDSFPHEKEKIPNLNAGTNEFESLPFNLAHKIKGDRKYALYLLFPPLVAGIENISIRGNDFYWQDQIINNPSKGSTARAESKEFENAGSGFFIDGRGYVVTNHHVIEDATEIVIYSNRNGSWKKYRARVVKSDVRTDLAILQIVDNSFKPFSKIRYNFLDTECDVGTNVFAIGYPRSYTESNQINFSDGKVTSKSLGIVTSSGDVLEDITMYQISVPLWPGSSGGPLFDDKGNLIGINTAARVFQRYENLYFAVKTQYLKRWTDVYSIKLPTDRNKKINKLKDHNERVIRLFKILKEYAVLIMVKGVDKSDT
jgi:S1-C subfamily serine protease